MAPAVYTYISPDGASRSSLHRPRSWKQIGQMLGAGWLRHHSSEGHLEVNPLTCRDKFRDLCGGQRHVGRFTDVEDMASHLGGMGCRIGHCAWRSVRRLTASCLALVNICVTAEALYPPPTFLGGRQMLGFNVSFFSGEHVSATSPLPDVWRPFLSLRSCTRLMERWYQAILPRLVAYEDKHGYPIEREVFVRHLLPLAGILFEARS